MRNYEKQAAEALKTHPAVDKIIAMSSYSEYRKGQNLVALNHAASARPIKKVIEELMRSLAEIPGIQFFIRNVPLIDLATGQESRGIIKWPCKAFMPTKLSGREKLIARHARDPALRRGEQRPGNQLPANQCVDLKGQGRSWALPPRI